MKRAFGISLVALLALAACDKKPAGAPDAASAAAPGVATAPAAAAMTPPTRKAGLWEHKMSTAGMTQVTRICFDEAVNRKMTLWGQQGGDDTCSGKSVTPVAGGWTFASTCNMGSGGTIVSQGEAKGDFGSHYTVNVKSSTTGAGAPQMNGEHDMTLEATWKGPCPADFKAGDMEVNGMKINMLDIGGPAGPGAAGGRPSPKQIEAMRKQMMAAAAKAQQ